MEWSENAVIGWQASSSHYRNHPLSGRSDASEVACLNPDSSYNTVIFQLNSVGKSLYTAVHSATRTYMYTPFFILLLLLLALCGTHTHSTESCTTFTYFGCFSGPCILSSERCDGNIDCSGGSDEVACSCELIACTSLLLPSTPPLLLEECPHFMGQDVHTWQQYSVLFIELSSFQGVLIRKVPPYIIPLQNYRMYGSPGSHRMKGIERSISAVTHSCTGEYLYFPGCALELSKAILIFSRKKAKEVSQFTLHYL